MVSFHPWLGSFAGLAEQPISASRKPGNWFCLLMKYALKPLVFWVLQVELQA